MKIAIDRIKSNPQNPRQSMPVDDLVSSMGVIGLIQPIIVRKDGDGFVVLSGHRRLAAAKKLGWQEIDACIIDDLPEDERVVLMAANVQQDLPPSKIGEVLGQLMLEKRISLERAARALGITPARAQVLIRLASESDELKQKVDSGKMSLSAYKQIMTSSPEVKSAVIEKDSITVAQAKKIRNEVRQSPERILESSEDIIPCFNDLLNDVRQLAHLAPFDAATLNRLQPIVEQIKEELDAIVK